MEEESDEYWKKYRTICENMTSIDFDSLSFDIHLLNEEGFIVDTEYAYVNNFKQGARAQLEFSTDKDFASYGVTVDYWYE